ncbi:Uncharacterised protein [Clostridium fallax]|uniref:Uncharacterized protein n=1 Tax=Clostridium fallax TaxID=1533 RepID=A0A1M4XQV1_9CLOT|nr:hypothetical protein SAMN05443638_12018 [Clostridium fallax]SQB08076.1 Uncharacterised protein [Clostridium fallax]
MSFSAGVILIGILGGAALIEYIIFKKVNKNK